MDAQLESFVRRRAHGLCEYCQLAEVFSSLPFEIDHIIAQKHGGKTESANLALSCFYCNSYKGPNIAGVASDGSIVRLFNPRADDWNDHFYWEGPILIARTPFGQATISVLNINHPDALIVRESLIDESVFPPHTS